jgi:hypothetical protein
MEDFQVTLSWKNISLTVEEKIKWNKTKSKTILRDLAGYVKPGEVLASKTISKLTTSFGTLWCGEI